MITGDHPVTARAIARQIGILVDDGTVLTGRELQTLSDAELRAWSARRQGLRPRRSGTEDPHRQGVAGDEARSSR